MRFENYYYFFFLVFILLFFRKKNIPSLSFPIFSNFKNTKKSLKVVLYKALPFLKSLILVFFVIALANPQKINEKIKQSSEGIDIMLLVDISDSMRSEDFQPNNRLAVAKNVITDFVKNRVGDRIGLIAFSAESYTRCPLTSDYEILLKRLQETEINQGELKHGTAIGMAISNGIARLKDSKTKSKIMVLLTDGENNSGVIDPITASELSADHKIKIYSVAIGKDGRVPYPITGRDFFGNNVKEYTYVNNKINTEIFQKISSITGGSFYRATDTDALKNIFTKIDKLEKSEVKVQKSIKIKDYFPVFIKLVSILFLLLLFLESFFLRRLPV